MEIKVPLQIALNWLGDHYNPEYDVYQISVCGEIIHIQLFGEYATILSTYNFSFKLLTELVDYMKVVAAFN